MSPTYSLPLAKSEDISPYGNAYDDQSLKELISLETDLMYFWSFIDHQGAVYEKKNIYLNVGLLISYTTQAF